MKILLLCDESEVREKVLFTLDSTYGAEVTDVSHFAEAEQFLRMKEHGFDFLICDMRKPSVHEIEIFLATYQKIPTVLCVPKKGEKQPVVKWNLLAIVDRTAIIQNMLESVDKLVNTGVIPRPLDERDFCRIRTKLLLSVVPLKGDIYIRLSEKKFVKLFHKGAQFEASDMRKYTYKKGIEYLYIMKNDVQEFIDKYQKDLDRYLDDSYRLNIDQMAELNESIYETVKELGDSVGFTKSVQQMAKTHVRMTLKSMGNSPKLSSVLKTLDKFRGEYLSAHSSLCGFLACAIASHMHWGSEATFHKLNLAAFLHDITLESSALARFRNVEGAKAAKVAEAQLKSIADHPSKAAEIARGFTEVPPDVDSVFFSTTSFLTGRDSLAS